MQIQGSNDLQRGNDVRLIFTTDNDQATAAANTVYFFPGAGNAAGALLPVGVTMATGDWTSRVDQVDYFKNVVCSLVGLRLETNDTNNYKNTQIVIGEKMPNGEVVKRKIYLNKFQVSDGNGLNSNLEIPMSELGKAGMFISPQSQIYMEGVKKNSYVAVYAAIPAVARSFTTEAVQY